MCLRMQWRFLLHKIILAWTWTLKYCSNFLHIRTTCTSSKIQLKDSSFKLNKIAIKRFSYRINICWQLLNFHRHPTFNTTCGELSVREWTLAPSADQQQSDKNKKEKRPQIDWQNWSNCAIFVSNFITIAVDVSFEAIELNLWSLLLNCMKSEY
jgi:hypothetical protein